MSRGAKEITTFAHLADCVSSKTALNVLLMGKLPRLDIEHVKYNNQNSSIYIKTHIHRFIAPTCPWLQMDFSM